VERLNRVNSCHDGGGWPGFVVSGGWDVSEIKPDSETVYTVLPMVKVTTHQKFFESDVCHRTGQKLQAAIEGHEDSEVSGALLREMEQKLNWEDDQRMIARTLGQE